MSDLVIKKFSRVFGSSFVFWFFQNFFPSKKTKVIFSPSSECSKGLLRELSILLPPETLAYFPSRETFVFQEILPANELVAHRIDTILKLQQKTPFIIVSEITSLAEKIPNFGLPSSFSLTLGQKYPRKKLLEKFLTWGYVRMQQIEEKGEFSMRGEVLDIFPIQSNEAYRLNFFDEMLESIRILDTNTQLSSQKISKITIIPAKEIIPSKKNIGKALNILQHNRSKIKPSNYQKMYLEIEQGLFLMANKYLPYFCNEFATWLDLLPQDTTFFLWKKDRLDFTLQTFFIEAQQEHKNISMQEELPPLEDFYYSLKELLQSLTKKETLEIYENEKTKASDCCFLNPQNFFTSLATHWVEKLKLIKKKQQDGVKIIFCTEQKHRLKQLAKILEELDFYNVLIFEKYKDFYKKKEEREKNFNFQDISTNILLFPLQESFYKKMETNSLEKKKLDYFFVSEKDLWNKKNYFQKIKKQTDFKTKLSDLKKGDFVVHIEHGIGKYLGLENVKNNGQIEDFLLIEYAGNAKLYTRADEINYKIQHYNTTSNLIPIISELGSNKWKLKRKKVEKGIEEIAEGLLRIYAERQTKKRPAFLADKQELESFAKDFSFIETEDQLQAIQDVFQDLSSQKPMDRLICGDAGFGKTEVAIRAAFQVAITGFQVLLLAPTTILVNQHFQKFRIRFKNFPIRIEFINSFLTPSQIKQKVTDFQQKKIEILIGTHSLLDKSFSGDSIGLLIIDEEHRFGVKQKEKLREYRANINILSMSATPIPRTLNLSLLGIRDISLITTPPQDRKKIKTKVLYYEDALIKEIVKRETVRGGQVFVVYNQVASMDSFLKHLQEIIPHHTIGVAHGQMPKKQLEKIMLGFSKKQFSILLSTTIIESGLDIPNANSLIVYDASRFGLSQLYQIRGRVGRSNKQAFVYFFLIPDKKITDKAKQRLEILQQIQGKEGYKIASQDLEIRGVGNLVGIEQSGHLQTIGYELFMAMLEETIQKIKEPQRMYTRNESNIFSYIKGYISEKFIPSMSMRLYIYQTINQCYNEKRIVDFNEELTDRFGLIPKEVENLFEITRLKNFAYHNQLLEIYVMPNGIKIKLAKNFSPEPNKILQLNKNPAIKFLPDNNILLQKEILELKNATKEITTTINHLT